MICTKLKYSVLAFGLLTLLGTSCKRGHDSTGLEFAPQMYRPVGPEPYRQTEADPINPYGLSMREPVRGTVSRANYHTTFGKGANAVTDLMVYNIPKDSLGLAERTLTNPIPETDKTVDQGKVLYGRYCTHCHGAAGKGDGLVGQQYKGVPSYSADAYKTMNDGHIFHVITNGKGRMWPHGSQITPEERWLIVQYVHQLQKG